MKSHYMALLLLLLYPTFSIMAQASVYNFHSDKGTVQFVAKGRPALIAIKGTGDGATGSLNEMNGTITGEIQFQLKSLNTGIDLRDSHLKSKYLEVEKFPIATVRVRDFAIPTQPNESNMFKGILNLHGMDRPIEGEATVSGEPKIVSANFKIRLSDFNIEIPSFQGITVAEEVQIKVEASVSKME
ncbi:MAG: YceI family protein [Bdellovibrionales bacterium]|nr:YceI family protein [Bdellovibrionales bacterium]